MNRLALRSAGGLLVAAVFGFAWYQSPSFDVADFAASAPAGGAAPAELSRRFASSDMRDFVHSALLTALPDGALMAAWFAGTREGSADVQIRAAQFDADTRQADRHGEVIRGLHP